VAEPPLEPALLTRTSRELLGERPLPTLLQRRPVSFLLGPPGVGKRTVAARLLPPTALHLDPEALRRELTAAGRHRRWSAALLEAPGLLLDGVDCLHRRYGAIRLLGDLLSTRARAGLRTGLTQGPADTSVTLLYPELPPELRATVLLRFPVGGGRRRFVRERCEARGIDFARAGGAVALEPWTYAAVELLLDGMS
jgi:hypothetical protein